MKSPASRRKRGIPAATTSRAKTKPARSRCRAIIRVDDSPLRKRANTECRKLMRQMEAKRAVLQRFESADRPAFQRWESRCFGALLTEIREIEQRLAQKHIWIAEIEEEMFWTGCKAHTAYLRVKARFEGHTEQQKNAEREEEDDASGMGGDDFSREKPDGEDRECYSSREAFDSFLREMMGLDPARMPKKIYESMFAQYKADMEFLMGDDDDEDDGPDDFERFFGDAGSDFQEREREPARGADTGRLRCKELYRELVRRLHPDLRADGSPAVGALWHEVQEAYAAGDAERLQTLLALTDIERGNPSEKTSLWDLRQVAAELRRSLRALDASLRNARTQPEWNFSQVDLPGMEAKMRRDLEMRKTTTLDFLDRVVMQLERWATPPPPRSRKKAAQRKPPVPDAPQHPPRVAPASGPVSFQASFGFGV